MTTSIKLGDKVKDKISDFSGIVSAKCTYLHESTRFGVTPAELDKDGNKRDTKMKNKYPNTRDDPQSRGGSCGAPPAGLIIFIGLLVAIIITTLNI